jgi:hypothetical protein
VDPDDIRTSVLMSYEPSEFDKAHVGEILRGHGDWFGADLLRLIVHADPVNRERLRRAFPEHVELYESWLRGHNE